MSEESDSGPDNTSNKHIDTYESPELVVHGTIEDITEGLGPDPTDASTGETA